MSSSMANSDNPAGTGSEDPSPTLSISSTETTTSSTSSSSTSGMPLPPNVHAVVAQTENVDQVIENQLEHMDATARARDTAADGVNGDISSSNSEYEGVHNALRRYSSNIAELTARQYYTFVQQAETAYHRRSNEDKLDGVEMKRSSQK